MTTAPRSSRRVSWASRSPARRTRLLTGHGLYVDDVKVAGTLHAAFLRSDLARAAITGVDTSAAKEHAGRRRRLHVGGLQRDRPGYHAMLGEELVVPPPLAITDVRYVGDPVAVVIAESRYLAEDACEAIEVDYDAASSRWSTTWSPPPTPRTSCTRAGASSRTRWLRCRSWRSSPDLDDAFANAAHVVECDVVQNRYVAMPMETRGIVVSYHQGRDELEIVCATQSVHETRNFFARYLQIPDGNVRVTARDVGGGFGQKMFVYREECAVALASYLLGRPVKWIEDRRENLLSAGHSRNEYAHVRMAVDDDGIIQAITADAKADVGAYAVCPAAIDPMLVPGPYKIPRYGFAHGDGLDQHHGQGGVPRPVDVRDHRARGGHGLRGATRSASTPPSSGAATCSRAPTSRSPHRPATCSRRSPRSRRSSRRSRSSTTTRSARNRRPLAPRAGTSASGSAPTWSRRRWAATRWPPRRPR